MDWILAAKYKRQEMNGIIRSSGKTAREQRRFSLKHLKDFGFGKSSMEEQVSDEVKQLLNDLKNKIKAGDHENVKIMQLFNLPVVNSLWKIMASQRLDINHPEEKKKIGT